MLSVKTSAEPFAKELAENQIPFHVAGNLPVNERPETELLTKIYVYWAEGSWHPGGGREMQTVTRENLLALLNEVTGSGKSRSVGKLPSSSTTSPSLASNVGRGGAFTRILNCFAGRQNT